MVTIIGEVAYFVQELIYFEANKRNMSLPLINKLTISNSNATFPTPKQNKPNTDNNNKIPITSIFLCNTSSLNTVDLSGLSYYLASYS